VGHDGTVSGINNQLQCEPCCLCNYAHVQVQFECQDGFTSELWPLCQAGPSWIQINIDY